MFRYVLWSERKRLAATQEREAAGESLWSDEIPEAARRKIAHIWEVDLSFANDSQTEAFYKQQSLLFRLDGRDAFAQTPRQFVQLTDTDEILTHIEAVRRAFENAHIGHHLFNTIVNRTFNEHRIAFRLVEDSVIPLASDELHVEIVEPTLRLLVDSRFADAHESYLKSLKEISSGDPADAITDAGTALQSALAALGVSGNSLGAQLKDAKKKGLLAPHDQNLADGIAKFIGWASADRNETGDAHKPTDPALSDAWLMVHVVGALILRLADPVPRSIPEG